VLHIDDDANQLIFTKRFLEEVDPTMWVESVSSPEEALRLLQEQSFDCVVSDYVMPGLDGVELAREIRETSNIPIFIYTGKGSEEVAERAFAAGVDDYLRKELDPSHYQVLAKRIKHAVEKHRTENVYQHVLNESLDAIVILDGTRIVFANQAQADLYGVDGSRDIIGRDVTEWNTDPERVRRMALGRQRGEPQPSRYEYSIRREDGEVRHVETLVSLIDYRGRPASLAFNRDITERKQGEEKLLEYADHLEEMVEEKTQEILDAERMVAAGRVASMVGHDLRGSLQTINNAVYLLRRTPDKSDELLSMINGAVQRASQMIEEFRIQTRDTPLKIEPIDLAALLDATVKETQIPESVKMDLRVGEGLENVSLDPLKMRRVLDNLVGNALDAMPDGGALTMIAGMREDEIVIRVSDTGVGIPEEEMPNLFKPFHTTKSEGVGLGLAYCKRAVEAHGGNITVESEVGKGTTFTVELPRVHTHEGE